MHISVPCQLETKMRGLFEPTRTEFDAIPIDKVKARAII